MDRNKLFDTIVANLKKSGAKKIALFGSYARHEEKKNSDIDILVSFNKTKSLMELVEIQNDLEKLTGKKIDLLTEKSISPYLISRIKNEMVKLY